MAAKYWEMHIATTLLDNNVRLLKREEVSSEQDSINAPDLCAFLNGKRHWIECSLLNNDNIKNSKRYFRGINTKTMQYERFLNKGIVKPDEPYILAFNFSSPIDVDKLRDRAFENINSYFISGVILTHNLPGENKNIYIIKNPYAKNKIDTDFGLIEKRIKNLRIDDNFKLKLHYNGGNTGIKDIFIRDISNIIDSGEILNENGNFDYLIKLTQDESFNNSKYYKDELIKIIVSEKGSIFVSSNLTDEPILFKSYDNEVFNVDLYKIIDFQEHVRDLYIKNTKSILTRFR